MKSRDPDVEKLDEFFTPMTERRSAMDEDECESFLSLDATTAAADGSDSTLVENPKVSDDESDEKLTPRTKDDVHVMGQSGDGAMSSGSEVLEDGGSDYDLEDNTDNDDDDEDMFMGVFARAARDPNPILPDTVTKLEMPDGSKIYLVGTVHFSIESQEDVAKTIQATQPDVVMVELCKGRVNILQFDEKVILEEAKNLNWKKMQAAIRQNGLIQGVMYLLLLSMSAHLTKQLGMAPGGEFRRAFAEAKKVPGCLIHLGDRPIQITFQRALAALSWWQKLRLAWHMITSKEPISKEEVERCKQRDILEELLAEMTGEFPVLKQVFVQERDIYLTHSLQLAVGSVASHSNSGPAQLPAVVVGVVGIGHVPGIVENWGKISENDIPQLLKIPEASYSGKIIRYTFRASILGLVLWGCYRTIPFQRVSKFISSISPFKLMQS